MRGYSSVVLGLTVSIFMFSSDIGKSQRVYLGSGSVKADRTSPAFSAFEDAFILKNFAKEKIKAEKTPQQKINLRGLKVSFNQPLKKIVLKGERIEVAHFTHKFLDKKKEGFALGRGFKLASIDTNWNEKIHVSTKIKIENLEPNEINVAENKSLSAAEVERVELPSGIVLTRPININEIENPKVLAKAKVDTQHSHVNHIAYDSSAKLKGKISLDGGDVAFDKGQYVYYLERKFDGHIFETGTVSALDSKFEIEVAEPKGILSIELRSLSGDVLAYGEKVLSLKDKTRNLALNLFPSEDLFSGRVLKNELSKEGIEVAEASSVQKVSGVEGDLETDGRGYFNESIFEKGSSFVVETKAKNRWPELNIGISGKPLYPRLLDKKALTKISKDLDPFGEDIEVRSLLMGSVTQLGLFQREVKIRIYNQEHQRPVYFNSARNIDHTLKVTSSSGGFAFANLPSGGYLVQALRGEKLLAQKWFIVKEGHLSKGQIELNKKVTAVVSTEVFPARVKVQSPLVFEEMGVETKFELGQAVETQIELKSNPQLTVFKSKKDRNFKEHIYVTSSKMMKKRFKLLSKEWLESFLNSRRSNANRAMGMIVGFVNDEDFAVVKQSSNSLSAQSQIFYFDKNGDYTDQGQAGGGFIITDVNSGVKTTVISLSRKKTFLNKITIAKPYSVSIF